MCQFFSFCSISGKPLFFNAEQRREIMNNEGEFKGLSYNPDSHTSIADFFGYKGKKEDELNKYEFNPLLKEFIKDRIGGKDDSPKIEKWVKNLDFKTIVPKLIVKPIIHPFKIEPPKITEKHIELLKQWASVRASVRASVEASVWASVEASVWDSVGASVRASVEDSVWDSVWDSVEAYISSFFDIWNGKNPYQSCIDLWEMGLIPASDGKIWYLTSKNGIEWKGKI